MKRFISGQNSRLSLNTSINRSQDGLEPRQSKVSNEKSWFEIFNRCYLDCFRSLPGWISLRRNPKKILSRYIIWGWGGAERFNISRLQVLKPLVTIVFANPFLRLCSRQLFLVILEVKKCKPRFVNVNWL